MLVADKRKFSYNPLLDHRTDETNLPQPPFLEHLADVDFFEQGNFLHCLNPQFKVVREKIDCCFLLITI